MLSNDRHRVYTSLETDEEFCARVREKHPWYRGDAYHKGDTLDEAVWHAFKIQRRFVERSTDPTTSTAPAVARFARR